MKRKFKEFVKKIIFKFIRPNYIKNTYSQAGEDALVRFLFNEKKIHAPSYLDLGANAPDDLNNTFLFYQMGSTGVCVEADETLIERIKQLRPKDTILNIGVGMDGRTEGDFYIFNHSALNTFDKLEAEFRERQGNFKIVKVVKVKLKDINEILSENFVAYPDFLSIDIEGLDLDTLKTLDFNKFPIPVICVETCNYSENHIRPKDIRIIEFMNSKDYFVYGDTYINTVFVNTAWFYSQ